MVRKGDGTGLAATGYSQVRKGDGTVLWNAIPDSVVDNFEDGDITISLKDNWTGWNGDTDPFQAQQTTVLAGDWSARLDANGVFNAVTAERDTPDTPTESRCLFQANSRNGDATDSFRFGIRSGTSNVFRIFLRSDGDLETSAGTTTGSWTTSTLYLLRVFNIDFANDQTDWEVVDQSDGTVIASGTTEPFATSASDADNIQLLVDSRNSTEQSGFYDDVEWVQ